MAGLVEAVERDLERLRRRDADLADGTYAALALAMASRIDDAGSSTTSVSMAGKTLKEAMDTLFGLAPEEERADALDELQKRRERRRAVPG